METGAGRVRVIEELSKTTLGEGPWWGGGKLHYVDIVEGKIHRHDFATSRHDVLSTGDPVGFAVLDGNGNVVAGIGDGGIYQLSFGSAEKNLVARPARENPANLANDGKCDRRGRLWAGTKNRDEKAPDTGSLARFDSGARMTEALHPVHISNGLGWSPDNRRMYYNHSTDKIWCFDYDIETGEATNQRVFVDLPNDGAIPDGMTVDSSGLLYVAMWGGSRVDVYRDENGRGVLVETISVPGALQVSSVAFGGEDLKTLFITSAAVDLTPDQQKRFPDSGRLFQTRRFLPGLPEACFR